MNDSLWTVMEMPMKHRMMAEPACVVKELCFWLAWLCEWSSVVFFSVFGKYWLQNNITWLHVHVSCVYIVYIFSHPPGWKVHPFFLCDCVVFSFSPVSCSRNPGCSRRSWALNVPLSCADCSASRTARATGFGSKLETWEHLGTVNGTPNSVTVLFMSQCSYGCIWKLDMPPK